MLSTISPLSQADSLLGGVGYGGVFPSSQGGFMPWESFESFFVSVGHRQIMSSCQGTNSTKPFSSCDDLLVGEGIDKTSTSHDDEPNQTTSTSDDVERKRKRKISNRESAKRSRMRKQQHIENLRDEANRLKLENQQGMNRLRLITHNFHLVTCDNDRLKCESVILQRRLMELNQILQIQQLHRNYNNINNNHHDDCNLVHSHPNYLT